MTLLHELLRSGVNPITGRPGSISGEVGRAGSIEVSVTESVRTADSAEVRAALATDPLVLIDRSGRCWLLRSSPRDESGPAVVLVVADEASAVSVEQAEMIDVVVAVLAGWFGVDDPSAPEPEGPPAPSAGDDDGGES